MKPREKVLPPIQSNAGLQRKLEGKILQVLRREALSYCVDVLRELYLQMTGRRLTQDEDPDGLDSSGKVGAGAASMAALNAAQKDAWNRLQQVIKARGKIPEDFISKNLSSAEASVIARRLIHAGESAKSVSGWYVRTLAKSVTASQRSQLLRAGVRPDVITQKWKVQPVKQMYISPQAAKGLGNAVTEMTSKIVRLSAEGYANVRGAIFQGLLEGFDQERFRQRISFIPDFDWEAKGHPVMGNRAQRVALDQTNKVTQFIARANMESIGCTQGRWLHVPGAKESRETHEAMDGKLFDLTKGLWDSDVNEYVLPGQLPFCRCKSLPVLPPELFGDVK